MKICIRFVLVCTVIASVTGCGATKVDDQTITQDLKQIASKTFMKDFLEWGNTRTCDTGPVLEHQSHQIDGQSCAANKCQVNVTVTVKVTDAMKGNIQIIPMGDGRPKVLGCLSPSGSGFSNWMGLPFDHTISGGRGYKGDVDGLQPGAIRKLNVKLNYLNLDQ